MSKRAWVGEGPESPPSKRGRRCSDGPIRELVASLGSSDPRMRSAAIAGLKNRHSEEEEEELQQRLWTESDPSVSQQIVGALAGSALESSALCALLQRYYSSCCHDSTKICILSCLLRSSCKSAWEEAAEAMLLDDLERENPVLRMWVLKFLLTQHQQRQQQDRFVSDLLSKKFFDPHELVRRFCLEAAISLQALPGASLEILNTAALQLLRDPSESIRILAMKLLCRWVTEVQTMKEKESSLESRMNYYYLLMCTMVTDLSMRARKEACTVLGAMTSASYKVKLHSLSKKSVLLVQEDPGLLNGREAPVVMAAGAFVSAVEDEFPEVRLAAIQALTSLSLQCTELISSGVLALLLDMLNDQHVGVRMDSIRALCQLADKGVLFLEQKHLQVVCDVLRDCEEVRMLGRRLLVCIKLPTMSMFKFVVQTLLNSLDQQPQDQEDIYKSLLHLGNGHVTYVELLTDEFAREMKLLLSGERGVDDCKVKALLNLCLGSLQSANCTSSWLPSELISCARLTGLSHQDEASVKKPEITLVIQRALSVKPPSEDTLRVLSSCRKALSLLEPSPQVNLGGLYLEFLALVAQLSRTAMVNPYERLVTILRSMQVRFSGFTAAGALQLLELNTFTIFTQPSGSDVNAAGRITSQLSLIVEESKKYSPVETFTLLSMVEEQLKRSFSDSERMKVFSEAAKSFWPSHDILGAGIEEMRGYLKVPASDSEHRLRFVAGFPYQLMVTGEVKHITAGSRIWIEMRVEDFPCQYVFLPSSGGGSLRIIEELVYYNMPFVAAGILRVCMVAELHGPGTGISARRGPQASVVPISAEHFVYIQADNI